MDPIIIKKMLVLGETHCIIIISKKMDADINLSN